MAWYHTDPDRLDAEANLMQENTNGQIVELQGDRLAWVEDLVSKAGQRYCLRIAYPDRFPFEPPKAFVQSPDISGAPHRLSDGSLCLWDNPFAADGPKTTALVVRNRAVVWFLVYEAWRATGAWAAPQHGGADRL